MSRLLGGHTRSRGELLSFLLFERTFVEALIEAGQGDAERWLAQASAVLVQRREPRSQSSTCTTRRACASNTRSTSSASCGAADAARARQWTTIDPLIHGCSVHVYVYVPARVKRTVYVPVFFTGELWKRAPTTL